MKRIWQIDVRVNGVEMAAIEAGLEKVQRWVHGGFTSGFDRNEKGSYCFEVGRSEPCAAGASEDAAPR